MPPKNTPETESDTPDGAATPANGNAATDLATAAQSLTQAAQLLAATANQLMQVLQGMASQGQLQPGGGVAAAAAQINTWEDDPYSEAVPTVNPPLAATTGVNVPVNNNPRLRTAIVEPRPAPGRYNPGTANFRYWLAEESLVRGINFWAPLLPAGTTWSTSNPMQVTLVAGQTLNASYSRQAGLRFYQRTVRNVNIFSGESPDVVLHELGHAILDALRPRLFNAASLEVDAFHEAFGDMTSILGALQVPTLRQRVLAETRGQLNVNSRLSRVAEQLGWGIRQLSPTAVDRDSLRNAANRFFYQRPALLPPSAPASSLSSEAHSFARVFTGAFLDALAGMLQVTGAATDANLLAVGRDLGQLLVDGIRTAPITAAYYSQVAASMIQADRVRHAGRYRTALTRAFIRRGILSIRSVAALDDAPTPAMVPVQPVGAPGIAAVIGDGGAGARTLLAYDDGDDQDYAHGYGETQELPVRPVAMDLGLNLSVHAPDEPERFSVAPSVSVGAEETESSEDDARHFVEDLLQLGRIELGSARDIAPQLGDLPTEESAEKTHVLEDTLDGPVLKRHHFNCGYCCR